MCAVSQETKLLQTIDRLKAEAAGKNKAARTAATLRALAAPKLWDLANGRTVQACLCDNLAACASASGASAAAMPLRYLKAIVVMLAFG